jgi:hypothetical protein
MSIEFQAASEFFRNIIDKIMVVAGIISLLASVALFSPMYQWVSEVTFLSGVLLIVLGAVLHFESFTLKVPSREGWGTILMCVAAMFMATAVMFLLFAVPGGAYVMPTSFRRGAESIILISLTRPNAWLAPILIWVSVGFLVFGLFLKFSRDIF